MFKFRKVHVDKGGVAVEHLVDRNGGSAGFKDHGQNGGRVWSWRWFAIYRKPNNIVWSFNSNVKYIFSDDTFLGQLQRLGIDIRRHFYMNHSNYSFQQRTSCRCLWRDLQLSFLNWRQVQIVDLLISKQLMKKQIIERMFILPDLSLSVEAAILTITSSSSPPSSPTEPGQWGRWGCRTSRQWKIRWGRCSGWNLSDQGWIQPPQDGCRGHGFWEGRKI